MKNTENANVCSEMACSGRGGVLLCILQERVFGKMGYQYLSYVSRTKDRRGGNE